MLWNVIAILLLLLKIIGILLLILLFLIGLILFVPLRYRVSTTFYEEKRVQGRASWLWFVARAVFVQEKGEMRWKLRIFGIPVLAGSGDEDSSPSFRKKKRKKRNKKRKAAKNKQNIENKQKIKKKREKAEDARIEKEQAEKTQTEDRDRMDENTEAPHSVAKHPVAKSIAKESKRRGIIARLREFWEKIKNFFRTLQKLFRLFRQKVHSLHDLADLLRKEEAKLAICIMKDNVIHLWKQLSPRKIRGEVVFGTGDPCLTGQALGVLAVLYGRIGSGVHITPDFQEQRLEGKLDVTGRIHIIVLIVFVVKTMFHKDIKQLWQKLEQWKEDF